MTNEERYFMASRIKWELIELLSEPGSPVSTEGLKCMMDAIDWHVQAMEERLPDAA